MIKQLEVEALRADLASVTSLLVAIPQHDDPIGHLQFTERKKEIERRLAAVESRIEAHGTVGLFFGGRPVVGSRGIVASFGTRAVEEFQKVIATRLASRNRRLGQKGPIPQVKRAQMLITDAVRGSFGFVLEELSPAVGVEDTELKTVMTEVVDLLNNTTTEDESAFVEAREEMDERVLTSVKGFLGLLDHEGATLRIVENGRDFAFSKEAIQRGKSRTADIDIVDETVRMTGVLFIIPYGRRFDLRRPSGEVISGKIDAESLENITEENGEIGRGSLGTWCEVSVLIHTVRKNGLITHTTYRLVDVISTNNPHPDTPAI